MKKIAILFPGQGSQYVGMGREMYDQYDSVKHTFEEASDTLGIDLKRLCWHGQLDTLTQTSNAQPALLTLSVAYFRVFKTEFDFPLHFLAGHSLGEFSALVCSGALSFADALRLVRQRGEWMEESSKQRGGGMIAVRDLDPVLIEQIIAERDDVFISCYNTQNETVLSGSEQAISDLLQELRKQQVRVTELTVSAPFHSPYMADAQVKMAQVLSKITFGEFRIPVISNVTARPYECVEQIPTLLSKQMTEAVRWKQTMRYLLEQGVSACIEMGPKSVLKRMATSFPYVRAFSFDQLEDRNRLAYYRQMHPPAKIAFIQQTIAHAVATKNHNHDEQEYQVGVIKPYEELVALLNVLDEEKREPTESEIRAALNKLLLIFRTKQVKVEEQIDRIEQMIDLTRLSHLFFDIRNIVEEGNAEEENYVARG